MDDLLARAMSASPRSAEGDQAVDADWVRRWPILTAFLTHTTFPDGRPRVTSTLLMLTEEGVFKGVLNDRAQDRQVWRSGDTVEELLSSLDEALGSGSCDWRKPRKWKK